MTAQILKINTALANKPLFVKLNHDMSLDAAISEAISTLRNSGKPLEAQQLTQQYERHQIFNHGAAVEKGSLISELFNTESQVGDQIVNITEIDLVTAHSGGIMYGTES